MSMSRVVLSYVDDSSHTITLDVCLTEDDRIRPGWSVLGWMGRLSHKDGSFGIKVRNATRSGVMRPVLGDVARRNP